MGLLELATAGIVIRKGLGTKLAPAVVRLCWSAFLLALIFCANVVPGRWEGLFAPVMTNYWLAAIPQLIWMYYDARRRHHQLSPLVLHWLGGSMVVSAIAPLFYHEVDPALLQGLCTVATVLACVRVGTAAWNWRELSGITLVWRRDGTYTLSPPVRESDVLLRRPDLLLQVVEHSAYPEYRRALLHLLQIKLNEEHPKVLPAGEESTQRSNS